MIGEMTKPTIAPGIGSEHMSRTGSEPGQGAMEKRKPAMGEHNLDKKEAGAAEVDEQERPFFVPHERAMLYCFLHRAQKTESLRRRAVVVCPPYPWEYHGCDRVFVQLGRRLASEGIHALRFDYRGTRESTGDAAKATLQTQLADLARVIDELDHGVDNREIGLLGARMGATLAALAAEELERVSFLVLWDPVVRGRQYIDRCLRTAVTILADWTGESTVTRRALASQLAKGEGVEVAGYELAPGVYSEAVEIDLMALRHGRAIPCLVLQTQTREPRSTDPMRMLAQRYAELHSASQFTWVEEPPYWAGAGPFGMIEDRPELIAETMRWLRELR